MAEKIQRYVVGYSGLEEHDDGTLIWHLDHIKTLRRLGERLLKTKFHPRDEDGLTSEFPVVDIDDIKEAFKEIAGVEI